MELPRGQRNARADKRSIAIPRFAKARLASLCLSGDGTRRGGSGGTRSAAAGALDDADGKAPDPFIAGQAPGPT